MPVRGPQGLYIRQPENNEIGWKTEWFDHRLQWNGAVYQENWNNVQVSFLDPGLTGNVTFDTNGQNFVVKGLRPRSSRGSRAASRCRASASWNHSEQTNSPALINEQPGERRLRQADHGDLQQRCPCTPVTNPFGPIGAPTASSPPLQFSLRARYELKLGDYQTFVQASAAHSGHSFTQAGANPTIAAQGFISTTRLRFEDPAFTNFDAAVGIAKDRGTRSCTGRTWRTQHQPVHECRSVHRRADADAPAGHRTQIWLQFLT